MSTSNRCFPPLCVCVRAGSASRRCMLDNNGVAFWGPPSFARCVSLEYRYLHLSVSSLRTARFLLCQNSPRGTEPHPTSGRSRYSQPPLVAIYSSTRLLRLIKCVCARAKTPAYQFFPLLTPHVPLFQLSATPKSFGRGGGGPLMLFSHCPSC